MNSKEYSDNLYENSDFPFGIFTIDQKSCFPSQGPGYNTLHWHEDLQFTVIIKGSLSMMVGSKNYNLKTNEGIFINSKLLHMTNHMSSDGEYISFNFSPKLISILSGSKLESDFVHRFTLNYNLPATLLTQNTPWQKKILSMLHELYEFFNSDNSYAKDYETIVRVQYIWLAFIRNVKDDILSSSASFIRKQEYMQSMLSYIHKNYKDDISISNMAESVHISQAGCSRIFKKVLSISPYEYLLRYRLNKAIELLNTTDMPITEIALSVGFNDCSHFIQLFKKYLNVTPKAYRNSAKS